MALGARAGSVLWLVLREALLLVVIGLVIGVVRVVDGDEDCRVVALRIETKRSVDDRVGDVAAGGCRCS